MGKVKASESTWPGFQPWLPPGNEPGTRCFCEPQFPQPVKWAAVVQLGKAQHVTVKETSRSAQKLLIPEAGYWFLTALC